MTKTIRVGLICYGIDGMKIIRETLIKLRDNFNSDEKKPKVSLTFNLRDIPVYEFKLKSLNTEELDLAHDYLLNNLKDDRLLFRHISTK
jgi:translation initiation factor 2 alpha subunit (eIF-2alpha)